MADPGLGTVEPSLAATLGRVYALDDAPAPDARFLRRLEGRLTELAVSPPAPSQPGLAPLVAGRPAAWWKPAPGRPVAGGQVATIAAVLLTLAVGLAAVRLGFGGGGAPSGGVQGGTPVGDACVVAPRERVPAPPETGSVSRVLPAVGAGGDHAVLDEASEVPRGAPADPATVAEIEATLRVYVACQEVGAEDPAVRMAFYTDAYLSFALEMPAMATPRALAGDGLRGRLETVPYLGFAGVPPVEAAWALEDGRVGALLRPNTPSDVFVVFVRSGDRWLIDELAPYHVPGPGTPPAPRAGLPALAAVAMFDGAYVPREVTIPADTPVELALTNAGTTDHAFVVDDLGVSVRLRPGETTTIELSAPRGAYEFASVIAGRREAGMVGQLLALDPDEVASVVLTPTVVPTVTPVAVAVAVEVVPPTPVVVPTASATPSPIAPSAFEPTHQVREVDATVNLRAEPSLGDATAIVATLPPGTVLQYLHDDAPTADPALDGPRWMRFRTEDGAEGWMREIDVEPYES